MYFILSNKNIKLNRFVFNSTVCLFSFLLLSFFSNSQEEVGFSEPKLLKLSVLDVKNFFEEVHKGSPYVFDKERERVYLEQLSRIEIIHIPYVENKNLVNLSSIELLNKYNSSLSYDFSKFDPKKFNFIKYSFNFYSTSDQFIRVDNQDYIIHILPYTNF